MEYPILTTHEGDIASKAISELRAALDDSVVDTLMSAYYKAYQDRLLTFIYDMSEPFHSFDEDVVDEFAAEEGDIPETDHNDGAGPALEKGLLLGLFLARASIDGAEPLDTAKLKIDRILQDKLAEEIADRQFHVGLDGVIKKTGLAFFNRFKSLKPLVDKYIGTLDVQPDSYDFVRSGIGMMLLLFVISNKLGNGEDIEDIDFPDDAEFDAILKAFLVIESLPEIGEEE